MHDNDAAMIELEAAISAGGRVAFIEVNKQMHDLLMSKIDNSTIPNMLNGIDVKVNGNLEGCFRVAILPSYRPPMMWLDDFIDDNYIVQSKSINTFVLIAAINNFIRDQLFEINLGGIFNRPIEPIKTPLYLYGI